MLGPRWDFLVPKLDQVCNVTGNIARAASIPRPVLLLAAFSSLQAIDLKPLATMLGFQYILKIS